MRSTHSRPQIAGAEFNADDSDTLESVMIQISTMLLCPIPQSDATISQATKSDTPESDMKYNEAAFDAHEFVATTFDV